jgi:hypothetical protein
MKDSKKSSLSKLKALVCKLDDRDKQLKINAKTLWIAIDGIQNIERILNSDGSVEDIKGFVSDLMLEIESQGCKKGE